MERAVFGTRTGDILVGYGPFTALAEPDHLIVPIPLDAKRYLHRRFNQSAELARLLCQQNETGMFGPEALTRPKAGPTQA